MIRRVQEFTKPNLDEFIEVFAECCGKLGLDQSADVREEAQRSFSHYTKANWRDRQGLKIKFWPKIVEKAAAEYVKKQKVGTTVAKRDVHIPDCCFRPMDECECLNLIYRPERSYEFPRDMAKALAEASEGEWAVSDLLLFSRQILTVDVAAASDEYNVRSTATDLGRGVLDIKEKRDPYFERMGWWIEFMALRDMKWCHLADELMTKYYEGLKAGDFQPVFGVDGDYWDMCQKLRDERGL